MIALITQRESVDSHGTKVDILESTYTTYFEKFNLHLHPVSNFSKFIVDDDILKRLDLIILTGGGDVDGVLNIDDKDLILQKNRDQLEKRLLEISIERSIPVLAICRGFQFINQYLGGEISKLEYAMHRTIGKSHSVKFIDSEILVNNYHHYGIKIEELAPNLEILAIDQENNHVEAFYNNELKWLGLQWHPERKLENFRSRELTDNLIKGFINKGAIK